MRSLRLKQHLSASMGIMIVLASSTQLVCQSIPGSTPIYQNNSTYRPYSSYYQEQVREYRQVGVTPRQYTVDRYFYHRPTISPYLNLSRPSGPYVNNYYSYVKPEQERRAQLNQVPGASGQGGPQRTGQVNPYYGHWYKPRP